MSVYNQRQVDRNTLARRCLLAALEACQAAVQHLSARKRQYEAAGRKQFAPTLRFALVRAIFTVVLKLLMRPVDYVCGISIHQAPGKLRGC